MPSGHSFILNIKRSMDQTAQLDLLKPVFVTIRKPIRRAHKGILGRWKKDNLKAAGLDTGQFTAHSTRSASTSHAHSKGVPINDILKVAN